MYSAPKLNVSDFVSQCRERLHRAALLVKEALCSSQAGMKKRFDQKVVERRFQPGDKVLVFAGRKWDFVVPTLTCF